MASTGDAVYMIGGWTGSNWDGSKSVEKLARGGNTWQTMADLPAARGDCAAAGLNGKVYVAGGYDRSTFDHGVGFKNNLYVYDPATNTWTVKAPMNYARGDLQLVVKGDSLLAIGGEVKYTNYIDGTHENVVASHYVEEYYPEKDRWEVRAPLGEARFRFGAATSIWGTHVFGGSPVCPDSDSCHTLQSKTHEVFFELDHPDVWVNL